MCIICDTKDINTLINTPFIDCSYCRNIKEIPKELVNLKKLICQYTSIKEIPSTLVKLEGLFCNNCPLLEPSGIPKELVNLVGLNCAHTNITEIPKEFVNLEYLWCNNNHHLTHIPKELVKLDILNCSNCPLLTCIPEQFINLRNIVCDNCLVIPTNLNIENNSQKYRKDGYKKLVDAIIEKLVAITWYPKQMIDWCSFAVSIV